MPSMIYKETHTTVLTTMTSSDAARLRIIRKTERSTKTYVDTYKYNLGLYKIKRTLKKWFDVDRRLHKNIDTFR